MRCVRGSAVLKAGFVGLLALTMVGVAPSAHAAEPEFTLRIGTAAPSGTPWSALLVRIKKRLKKETDGRVKLKLYLGSKLGSETSMVRRCQKGSLDGIAVSNGALGTAVQELFATELPYLFDDYKSADKALDAATDMIKGLLDKAGFVFMQWGENGYRHFAHKEKFITKPSDLAGAKMRTQPAMPHVEMYKTLGASAFPISVGEVVGALAADNVSGYDNTLLYAYAAQWFEQVKYITLSYHIYQPALVVWCKKSFEKLPPDIQKILTTVPADEKQKGRIAVRAMNKILRAKYKEQNREIRELTAAEKKAMKDATKPVIDKFLAETSPEGKALYEFLIKNR